MTISLEEAVRSALRGVSGCCLDEPEEVSKVVDAVCSMMTQHFVVHHYDIDAAGMKARQDAYAKALIKSRYGLEPEDCGLYEHIWACDNLSDIRDTIDCLEVKYGLTRLIDRGDSENGVDSN